MGGLDQRPIVGLQPPAHTQPRAGETVEGESLLLEQLLCLPGHGDGEVLPPVLAEVQVSAAAAAADGEDAPLDQLEAAEPLAGRLGAAHGIEGVSPDAAAGSASLTLERQHLRDGAAIVGEADRKSTRLTSSH